MSQKFIMPKYNYLLKQKGFTIKKFGDPKILKDIVHVVKKHFNKSTNYYCKLPLTKFRKIALNCQNEIYKLNIQKRFHNSEKNFLKKILNNDEPYYESQVFFRIVRPFKKNKYAEAIDWHRETFYTTHSYPKHGVNIWFPIINVNKNNSLRYISKSHLINDDKIKRKKIFMTKKMVKNNPTKKFSPGHKMGFVYHPIKILSGVNLRKQRVMNIPKNHYSAFSTMLVHGNSQNNTNKIRFALGFGLMPKNKLIKTKKFDPRRLGNKETLTDSFVSLNRL
jgi:hypothetical protein